MNRIKASEFKAKCLSLMDEVADTGEPLVITKNGKPVATLVPYGEKRRTVAGLHGKRSAKPWTGVDVSVCSG